MALTIPPVYVPDKIPQFICKKCHGRGMLGQFRRRCRDCGGTGRLPYREFK